MSKRMCECPSVGDGPYETIHHSACTDEAPYKNPHKRLDVGTADWVNAIPGRLKNGQINLVLQEINAARRSLFTAATEAKIRGLNGADYDRLVKFADQLSYTARCDEALQEIIAASWVEEDTIERAMKALYDIRGIAMRVRRL